MKKIATPQDLQAELRRLLAYCQGPDRPSRETLAAELRDLADRTAGFSGGKVVCDQDPKDGRPVAYIDSKGYAYCAQHGEELKRNGRRGIRKIRPAELKKMQEQAKQ